ncbi:MAG: glycosyltransferase family 4 protein [Chthoniobacterales bacterium]
MRLELRGVRLVISGLALGSPFFGQGAYASRIIVGLLRRAPDFSFRVLVPEDFVLPEIPERNIVRLPLGRAPRNSLLRDLYWAHRVLRFAARLDSETIFHSPSPIAGFARAPRTAVTIHDCLYRTFTRYYGRSGVRKLVLLASERYAARSELVFTQSEFSKADLISRTAIAAEKIRILPPWVDERFFAESTAEEVARLRSQLHLPQRFWLYLGGFDYRKNVEFLLRAYAQAKRTKTVPTLVLAGAIPPTLNRAHCDIIGTLAREKLGSDAVLMPGPISAADLPNLYRAASLLIYPSLMEGFGLPPAEAMAVNTPVLVADNSSLPEVVPAEECRFDATNLDDLVSKLRLAADNDDRFRAPFSKSFTEACGVPRYLKLLGETFGDEITSTG